MITRVEEQRLASTTQILVPWVHPFHAHGHPCSHICCCHSLLYGRQVPQAAAEDEEAELQSHGTMWSGQKYNFDLAMFDESLTPVRNPKMRLRLKWNASGSVYEPHRVGELRRSLWRSESGLGEGARNVEPSRLPDRHWPKYFCWVRHRRR